MKQGMKIGLIIIIGSFLAAQAWAADTVMRPPVHTFKAGIDSLYFHYEEPSYMEEDGALFGLAGKYIYHGAKRLMLGGDIKLVWGELDYDGQTQDGEPVQVDTEDMIYEMRGYIGFDFYWPNNLVFTPFVGLGHRYWNDDIGGSGGYEREISYFYSPLGLRLLQQLDANWSWGLQAEYDFLLSGHVESHLSDVHPAFNDVENDQDFGEGYGLSFALEINRKISDRFGLSFEPYVTYWDIENSNVSLWTIYDIPYAYGIEPENETTAIGLRVYFTF